MNILPGPHGTFYLYKEGKQFGEVVFWPGYDRPAITYDTPPGLTPQEEEEILKLPNPWSQT